MLVFKDIKLREAKNTELEILYNLETQNIILPYGKISTGVYILQMQTNKGLFSEKVLIEYPLVLMNEAILTDGE